MTEEHREATGPGQDEPDEEEAVRAAKAKMPPFDPSLEALVMYINLLDKSEVGVTVHVKGAVISGLLISGRSFWNLIVKGLEATAEMSEGPKSSGAQLFADFFRINLDRFEKIRDEYQANDTLPPRPVHIHLRQASTYLSGGEPALIQPTWRGRISEVDGWSFGNFGESIPPLPEELA